MNLTVPDPRKRKKQARKEVAHTPSAFRRASRLCGSGTEGAPAGGGLRLIYINAQARVRFNVVSECVPTRRVHPTLPSLAGWPGGCAERRHWSGYCNAQF